jgi:hypothetical protein
MKTVSIVSCARQPSYLYQTLSSFTEPGIEVELFFQGQEPPEMLECVLGYQPEPASGLYDTIAALHFEYTCQIPRVYHTEKLFDKVHLNGPYNYAETLLHTRDGLILEDDVIVSKNFMGYVAEVEKLVPDENSIVALYSLYNRESDNQLRLVPFPVARFANTQAMLYPVWVARAFGQFILDRFSTAPYDMVLRDFCREYNLKIYATNYSLVQHYGIITTGLGLHHRATNFIDDFIL